MKCEYNYCSYLWGIVEVREFLNPEDINPYLAVGWHILKIITSGDYDDGERAVFIIGRTVDTPSELDWTKPPLINWTKSTS